MNISPKNPTATIQANIPKLKVVFGVTQQDLSQQLSDILALPPGVELRAFSWEGSRIPEEVIRECIETTLQDEELMKMPQTNDADIIAVMNKSGYRVVRDNREGRGPTEFTYITNNFFVIHDVGADLAEFAAGAVSARTEHFYENHEAGYAVTAVVVDERELVEDGNSTVAVRFRNTKPILGKHELMAKYATNAGIAGFIEHGAVAVSLMALGVHIDKNESMIRGNDDYGFVNQDLAQFLLWGMLKQSPRSPIFEVAQFIYTGIKFLKPDLSKELSRDVMSVGFDETGVGPWYFLLDTLKVAGIIEEVENDGITLTDRGYHFRHLFEIVAEQLGLE